MQIFLPNDIFPTRLTKAAREFDIRAVHIFDLQIALLSIDAGAKELWTHDAGFIKLPGINIVDPLI